MISLNSNRLDYKIGISVFQNVHTFYISGK